MGEHPFFPEFSQELAQTQLNQDNERNLGYKKEQKNEGDGKEVLKTH